MLKIIDNLKTFASVQSHCYGASNCIGTFYDFRTEENCNVRIVFSNFSKLSPTPLLHKKSQHV